MTLTRSAGTWNDGVVTARTMMIATIEIAATDIGTTRVELVGGTISTTTDTPIARAILA
jgi:hypothetical protein